MGEGSIGEFTTAITAYRCDAGMSGSAEACTIRKDPAYAPSVRVPIGTSRIGGGGGRLKASARD